ncbi:MAG: hypothetical protein U0414_41400 [Polyangiaceae bacterium]
MRSAVLFASLSAIVIGAVALAQGCYPDFEFGPGTGGGGGSTGARPDDTTVVSSASQSATHGSASSTAASPTSSSSDAASSTAAGMMGPAPPCNTAMPCVNEQCCFNKTQNNDTCGATCGSGYLSLACHDASDCTGGKICCTLYDNSGLGPLLGTVCDDSCLNFKFGIACDPSNSPFCTCDKLLGPYYQSGNPPPPYDQYGECQ